MTAETDSAAPELRHIFDTARMRHLAEETAAVSADFDAQTFLHLTTHDLDALSLMQRLRRVGEALHASLPPAAAYRSRLDVLRALAPRINNRFVTLVLPEYVARYGLDDFEASMQALRDFTVYGSSEFGVRPFLRQDLARGMRFMLDWSSDGDEHVRSLASEGSRPRLPWSFRLEALVADPGPTRALLDNLRADDSLYVRKSVANHLNDIAKDHEDYLLAWLQEWAVGERSVSDPRTNRTDWIIRHGLRTLVKRGDARALALLGAHPAPQVRVAAAEATPSHLALGEHLGLSLTLESTAAAGSAPQRLVAVSYTHLTLPTNREV